MTVFAGRLFIAATMSLIACHASGAYIFTDISIPGETESRPYAINNVDQTVGYFNKPGGGYRSFLWQDGLSTVLFPPIGPFSEAYAINDSGNAVGKSYLSGTNGYRALLWRDTSPTTLDIPEVIESSATGINSTNQVAGWAYFSNISAYRAIRWNGTSPTVLDTLGGSSAFGLSINDHGTVAGMSSATSNGPGRATIWHDTIAIEQQTPDRARSSANAINNDGQVVGWIDPAGSKSFHATMWMNNIMTLLDTLGGNESLAWDNNNKGEIVGESQTINGQQHATLWVGDTVVDLNSMLDAETVDAGWVLVRAWSINEKGWIVGEAYNPNRGDRTHAFLLSVQSVPEPSTLILFFVALSCLVVADRRHLGHPALSAPCSP